MHLRSAARSNSRSVFTAASTANIEGTPGKSVTRPRSSASSVGRLSNFGNTTAGMPTTTGRIMHTSAPYEWK